MVRPMSKHKDFILVGRTSREIATAIIDTFGYGERTADGRPAITRPGPVIQFSANAFEDGEVDSPLFARGDTANHPIVQTLTEKQKQECARRLKGADASIVIASSGNNTNVRAMGLMFLVRELKTQYGVENIRLISPALPFMRSDRNFSKADANGEIHHEFNTINALRFAEHLKFSGVDKVVGFEPHSRDGVEHYRSVFGRKNVEFINMGSFFANAIKEKYPLVDKAGNPLIMVGSPDGMNKPDDYGIARARNFGETLYAGTEFARFSDKKDFRKVPYMFGIHKDRIGPTETGIVGFHGDVAGKICIIIDDIISSGGTTLNAAQKLRENGARHVIAIATHGVLTNGAAQKLVDSPLLDRIMLTDTIPGVLDKLDQGGLSDHKKMIVQSVAPLIVDMIKPGFKPDKKLTKIYSEALQDNHGPGDAGGNVVTLRSNHPPKPHIG